MGFHLAPLLLLTMWLDGCLKAERWLFGVAPVKYWCFLNSEMIEVFQERDGLGNGLFRRHCNALQRRF